MKWTTEQEQAIYTKDCNLLVAAGAGSGKTAVLVERIINKIINDDVDIDRLLVVTFTNAAASEMRERIADRIYKEIENKPELQKQIALLGKASITTMHSFCLRVIRDNFFKVGLDPNFRIGDSTECELIKLESLEELLEEKYESDDEYFENIVNIYTSNKDDETLRNIILKIYNFIQSAPFPNKWLEEQTEIFNIDDDINIENTPWGNLLMEYARDEINSGIEELKELELDIMDCPEAANYLITIQNDIHMLQVLVEKCTTWDEMYSSIKDFEFDRLKSAKGIDESVKTQVTTIRDKVKDIVKKYLKEKVFLVDGETIREDLKYLYQNLKGICQLVKEFDIKFKTKKLDKNLVDFNDIEHIALKLLSENEDISSIYREQFDEILVDEYQDSNMIQEYILGTISKNRMFMVGDVKQSIYRFRQARPDLFLSKYNSYPNVNDNLLSNSKKILLFKNFRSNENIIDATNYIFEKIMSKDIGEIDYDENEFLKFGAEYYGYEGEPTEINLIETKNQDEKFELDEELDIDSNAQLEGKFIAHKIKELVGKLEVYDKKTGQKRLATYRDFVILLRSTVGSIDAFMEELTFANIPVYSDNTGGYFNNTEVQIIMALLKIIDNPIQDIPLIAVLRSQIGGFTSEELTEIRLADRNTSYYEAMQKYATQGNELARKVINFLEKISEWRSKAKYMSLSELLWLLYNETGYYYYISLFPDGLQRQSNLKLLLERAEAYEKTSFKGLFNFLTYIDNIKESSGDMESCKIIGENEDVVRIMSIHKSKGLEFPVVFLAGTTKKFNYRELNENLIFHSELGFGADVINYDARIRYPSISKIALSQKIKSEVMSEEMRILYVAMTRAREKLIITALVPDVEKAYDKYSESLTKYKISKATSFFDWIGTAVIEKKNNWIVNKFTFSDIINLEVNEDEIKKKLAQLIKNSESEFNINEDKNEKISKRQIINQIMLNLDAEANLENKELKEIDKQMNWIYIHNIATGIPSKISITELKRLESGEETKLDIEMIEKPDFMSEQVESGTRYGTLVHTALQKLDFNTLNIEETISVLTDDVIIRKSIMNKLNRFIKTSLFGEIKNAKKVFKETSFNLNLTAKEVYNIESNESVMIQGIIDLYFIDEKDDIVLVDYKTDNVKDSEELILKYKAQLAYYKRALEDITGKKVKKTVIYSLKLEKEISI